MSHEDAQAIVEALEEIGFALQWMWLLVALHGAGIILAITSRK